MATTSSSAHERAERRRDEISFFDLLTPLVRRWKLIAATALGCGVVAAVMLLLQPPTYTAKTTFTPETGSTSGAASGLAALAGVANQLGLGLGAGSSVSPDFFVKLASSAEVLRTMLLTEFSDPADPRGARRPLLEILDVPGESPEERLQRGVIWLQNLIEVTVDKPTGIVTLEVDMPGAELAASVANQMVQLLNQFNLERRQSQSREQRRFTGERLAEAEQNLRAAERAELAFLQRNRDYSSSPLLTHEVSRLERDVQVKQELFLTLSKAHTEARIAEVRDTPVLTVVDSAIAPFRRSRPQRTLGVLMAVVIGTLFGIAIAYVVDFRRRAVPEQHPDYFAMREAWEQARREVGSALGRHRG
ncbi:MAG TPA: GNVR domain-containing protein [Gemmatimonadales bacterium]|nr:GNVR domain-containing protein [Gemmatimonadales bacterium]